MVDRDPARARLTLGPGGRTYVVEPRWGIDAGGWSFAPINSVAVDPEDNVYVYQQGQPPIVVFDTEGRYVRSWGNDRIVDAHGMFITPDGRVLLVDRDGHRVSVFRADGELLFRIGDGMPVVDRPFCHPADVAVSRSGEIFVADGYGNARVHRFAPTGELIESWGSPGDGIGQFNVPHGIWVDGNDRVYVADRDNDRLQVFSSSGAPIAVWPGFHRPSDIYMDASDVLYVTETSSRIHVLDVDGRTLACGRAGLEPHGIWGDSRGDLYVVSSRRPGIERLSVAREGADRS